MTIIAAIILFGLIVFIHELGHFMFAKRAGVTIHEFAIGMGPQIFSKTKDGIKYSIRALPLGGYVSMEGEDGETNDPNSFGRKTILQRASILLAGPLSNILLAVILLIPVHMMMGTPSDENILGEIIEKSPAYEAGLKENDKVLEINGNKVENWDDIVTNIHASEGQDINLTVDREGTVEEFKLVPQKSEDGRYMIGIYPKIDKNILTSVTSAFTTTVEMIKQMGLFLYQLVTGTVPGGAENAVAGPIGVISIVSDAAKMGIGNLLYIAAVLSLNLGILNLLPIPALDGGRLLLIAIEAIRGGKKLDPNKEGALHMIGFFLLMGLMLFVTFKDITRLFQ